MAIEQDSLFFLLCDDLPDGEVEAALALIHRRIEASRRRVLCILADSSDRERLRSHLELGVQGLCTISSQGQGRIYTAVAAIATGGIYVDPCFHQRLHQGKGGSRVAGPESLTMRERQLLRDVCRGYSSQEIVDRHGLSPNSVRRHLSQIYRHLHLRDRAQAIGWCVAHGVISPLDLQQIYLPRPPRSGPSLGARNQGRDGCGRA